MADVDAAVTWYRRLFDAEPEADPAVIVVGESRSIALRVVPDGGAPSPDPATPRLELVVEHGLLVRNHLVQEGLSC